MTEKVIEKEKINPCQLNWVLRLFSILKGLLRLFYKVILLIGY